MSRSKLGGLIISGLVVMTLQSSCGVAPAAKIRPPKLLWEAELPHRWPDVEDYSCPMCDPQGQIVLISGEKKLRREKSNLYQEIVYCAYDASSGTLVHLSPTLALELGEAKSVLESIRKGGGVGVISSGASFSQDAKRVVLTSGWGGFRFHFYDVGEKKLRGPFIVDPAVGYVPSEIKLSARAVVFSARGKAYLFKPTAVIRIDKGHSVDEVTQFDLLEFDLEDLQKQGKKIFTFQTSFEVRPVKPCHAGERCLRWEYVLEDKYYALEYDSDSDKINVLAKKQYNDKTKLIGPGQSVFYDPNKKKLLQFDLDFSRRRPVVRERDFGESGTIVWQYRSRKETSVDSMLATSKLDKLALFMYSRDNYGLTEHPVAILDRATYRERYCWIEPAMFLCGAQFSPDGKRLYIATREERDKSSKHYLKCYQLEE